MAERRATLLGLIPPLGHTIHVIQHESMEKPGSTDRIHAALDRIAGKVKPNNKLVELRAAYIAGCRSDSLRHPPELIPQEGHPRF